MYCNQTLSNHRAFVWGLYSQINVILHCPDCSQAKKLVTEPLIDVKLSYFPISGSLEWRCTVALMSAGIQIGSYRALRGCAQLCWRTHTHACPCKWAILQLEGVFVCNLCCFISWSCDGSKAAVLGQCRTFHKLHSRVRVHSETVTPWGVGTFGNGFNGNF